jgi:hypothetical protein
MARRNRDHIPSITTSEILLEGPDSNTTARVSFQGNALSFQDTRTGEDLLKIDSQSKEISFSNPIRLPDGTLLNTVSDVSVRDFELRTSIPVVIYGADGQPKTQNEPVTIAAILTGLVDQVATFTTNPSVELGGTGNIRFLYPASLSDISKVDITATADEFSQTITITKVAEGSDGITVAITNPSDIISADSEGAIIQSDLLNSTGIFSLYKGSTNLTELGKVSYRVDDVVNISITIDPVTGEYQVTNFDQAATKGSATLVANYQGIEYTHTYRMVKAIAGQRGPSGLDGAAGADGTSPYIGLVTDENIFIDTVNNNNVANINTSALDANNKLVSTLGSFEVYKGTTLLTSGVSYYLNTTGQLTTQTKNNLTFTIDPTTGEYFASVLTDVVQDQQGWNTESETFTVRAVVDGITVSTRKIKIQKTKIGKDGKTGPSLKLNVSPGLFKFNGEGVPTPNQVLTITILKSNLPDGATVQLVSEPPLMFATTAENSTLAVENFSIDGQYLDSAVLKAKVILDEEVYLEDFVTIFRTQNGTDAKSIVLSADSQVFNFADSDSFISTTEQVSINIKTQNLTSQLTVDDIQITKNNGTTLSLSSEQLIDNQDGSYSISLSFDSLSITSKQVRDECFPIKVRADKQGVFDIISIHKLVGGDGALSGYLTNESDQIPAFADGTTQEEDYSTLNGYFKVFKGLEEITDQCSFAITYNENVTTTVNSVGFYSILENSISSSSNTARSVIQASYNGSEIQKVFTVTKTKQGKNTLNAIISNETHTVRAESNGNLILLNDLTTAGGVVYVYDGNDRVSSGVSYSVLFGNEEATQSGASYTTPSGLAFSINQITGVYNLSTSTLSSWTGNTETFYIKIQYSNAEIIKSYTITKSKGGADAKLLTLRSNRMVFTFDSDNNPSPSGQEVIFTASPTKGSVPLDVPVTWSVTPSSYQSLLKDLDPVDSKKKRISIEDFKTANLQNLLITAEADALEDSITIVKAKDGSSGENAKLIKVTATSMVVAYDTNEDVTPTPETITVFITQQNLSKILEVSDIVITKSDGTTINPSSVDSSGVNSSTKTGEAFFTISLGEEQADLIRKQDLPIKIQVSSTNDNVKDTLTINKISGGKDGTDGIDGVNGIDGVDGADGADGRDAITAFLTNESHTAPAESNGFVSNDVLGDAGGSFELYDGLTKIINTENTTDKVIFSVVGGNVVSDDSVLVLEGLKIKINQSTGVYSLSNDTNTSWSRNYQVFTLRAFYNGLDFDKSYTISKSKEGQKGIDGQPGTDSKTVKLESDDYQIAYDTESKNPDPATFTLTATQQNHDNNDAIYYFYEIDQSGNENLIPKGANDADNTRIITAPADKFRAKKYKVKTKESSDGDFIATDSISVIATKDGADSVTIVVPNDNHSFPADENGTVTTADLELGSTEIEVYLGNQRLEAVDSVTDGQPTVLDVNQFYVTKTESNITSSLVRIDQDRETNKYYKYFLSLSSISQDSATVALKVTLRGNTDSSKTYNKTLSYSKSRKGVDGQDGQDGAPGADGISPVNGLLSNESHTVVSTYDGIVANLNGSDGVFRVYRGQTEITSTSAVSFSVIGTQPQNGLSISIANSGTNKGKYQLTQTNWTSDSESFVLQALVDGTIVVQKTYTITKSKAGANGEPAKYLILESTKQSFDKKYDNNVSVFYPDNQTITFTPAIYGFSQAPTVTWYVDGAEVTNNLFLTTGSASATMSQDQFTAATLNLTNLSTTIKAIVEDGELSYSDQITVILSQQGKDGSTGRDAKTVSLVSDDYQIAYKQLGNSENWSKEPSSVTLTATGANTDAGAVIEYKFYINSQLQTRADNTSNEFVIDNFETTPDDFQKRNVKVELIEDGEVVATDTVTIFATREAKDGEAAVTISMPNSNHTFPASSLGVVDASSYSTGVTEIEVYIGNTRAQPVASSTTDESMAINTFKISNVTPVNIVAGLLSNISINGFVLTTTAPNSMDTISKTASLEFEIKVKDKFGVIKTFLQKQSFTKSERGVDGEDGLDGADGLNAKALFLLSDSEAFYYNKSGGVINSQINFTTIKENISSNVTFTSNPPGLLTNVDSVNGTATLTNSNFGSNQSVTVTATVVDGITYTDFISIKKVESGVDGSNGVDAKVVKLESNDYQIAYDKDGNNPEPASITFTATQQNHAGTVYYRFIKDGTQIQNTTSNTVSINLPENKFDSPISIKVETRNVSGATGFSIAADSISIVATKDGNDSYTISIPNDNHTFVANENGVVSDYSGGGTEVQVYLGNTALKAVSDITGSNEFKVTVVESNNITPSLVAALDNSSYTLTVGSMGTASDSATVSLAIEIRGQTGQIQTINKFLSYSKARKGAKGDDVFSGYLTNESHIVIADSDGSGYSLTTAGGTYEVFYGSQKLTSGVTYSVQGLNIKNGLTASINSSGVYSFSGANWSSDSDIFTFRASYLVNGQTINLDKIYSITKSKAGKPSISGYLTNETHTVQTTSTGTYTTLGSAGGTFQVLKGSESATGFTFTVDQTIKNNLTASINPTTGVYSFSGTGWNADSTSFIFTATSGSAPNATVIEKTYTITKSKAGTAGAAGSSAKAVFLYSDKQAFIKNGDGQFNPSTQVISLTASLQNISVQPSWYVDDVPVTNQITVSTNKLSASINETQFSSSSQTKKITVSADGLSDTITLIATKDGAAAKAVFLTSDKQTFKKDGDGTYYTGQEIKFNGREENTGEELIWSAYKIKADSTEQTLTVGNVLTNGSASSEKILTVSNYNTALSTDGTAIKIRVSVASGLFDETTIIPIQDGAEGQPGSAGVNAKSIKLTSTSYVINYNSAGKSASPSTITLTASPSSTITGSRTYSFTEGTGTSAISGTSLKQTTATATVSFSSIDYFTTPKLYKVTVYENNVEVANDSIAIAAVKEGSNARSVILSNEAHTVPVTTAGVVTYTGSGTDIEVLVGATKLTPIATAISPPLNNTFSVTSIDVIPANSITVGSRSVPYSTNILRFGEHSAMNASVDTVSITYNITAKDNEGTLFTLSKTQTITKSKQGETGADGNSTFFATFSREYFTIDVDYGGYAKELLGEGEGIPNTGFNIECFYGDIQLAPITYTGTSGLSNGEFSVNIVLPYNQEDGYGVLYDSSPIKNINTSENIIEINNIYFINPKFSYQELNFEIPLQVNVYAKYNDTVKHIIKYINYARNYPSTTLKPREFTAFGQYYYRKTYAGSNVIDIPYTLGWRHLYFQDEDSRTDITGGGLFEFYNLEQLEMTFPVSGLSDNVTYNSFENNYSFDSVYGGTWTNGLGSKNGTSIENAYGWIIESNGTNYSTGPSSPKISGTKYIYCYSYNRDNKFYSLQRQFNSVQTQNFAKMSFWYFLYGSTVSSNAIRVYVSENNGSTYTQLNITKDADSSNPSIVSAIGNQQQTSKTDSWKKAEVNLEDYKGKEIIVRIVGYTGSSFTSDIAIDYIQFWTNEDTALYFLSEEIEDYSVPVLQEITGFNATILATIEKSKHSGFYFQSRYSKYSLYSSFIEIDPQKSHIFKMVYDSRWDLRVTGFGLAAPTDSKFEYQILFFRREPNTGILRFIDGVKETVDITESNKESFHKYFYGTRASTNSINTINNTNIPVDATHVRLVFNDVNIGEMYIDLITFEETILDVNNKILNEFLPINVSVGGIATPTEILDVRSSSTSSVAGEGARIGQTFVGTWNGDSSHSVFTNSIVKGTANSFALMQQSDGTTSVNAASGKPLYLSINNSPALTVSSNKNATFASSVTANSFSGNGASLTSLNASNISSGTINSARLPTTVIYSNTTQTISGIKTFSSGIKLGSGTDTLDEYDEGTWTPTFSPSTGISYATNGRIGFYVKVGNLVHATCRIHLNTINSNSNSIVITGLPFASKNLTNYTANGSMRALDVYTNIVSADVFIGTNKAEIELFKRTTASKASTQFTTSDLTVNTKLFISIIYQTD